MSSIRLTAGYPSGEDGDVGSNPIWITKIFSGSNSIGYIVIFPIWMEWF